MERKIVIKGKDIIHLVGGMTKYMNSNHKAKIELDRKDIETISAIKALNSAKKLPKELKPVNEMINLFTQKALSDIELMLKEL